MSDSNIVIPTFDTFMNPVVQALKELGGSGTIEEINARATEIAGLSDEQLEVLHDPEKGGQTEVEYRLAWTRTYLKKYGLLENSSRGIWALTLEGKEQAEVDPHIIKRFVREETRQSQIQDTSNEIEETDQEIFWRHQLMNTLLEMSPDAFERLVQRMLRETGFVKVEVTGRSGDGGIDGKGIMRLGGVLSFHVLFQCKRYRGSVTAGHLRDFRGALVGRADKGLFVTTGNFTKDAVREATRDGAQAIELMDGDQLIDKLKELGLGIETKIITKEEIIVNHDWFSNV